MPRLAEQLHAIVVHHDHYFLKTFVRRATQLSCVVSLVTGACTMRLPLPSLQATGTAQLGKKLLKKGEPARRPVLFAGV